MHPRTPLVAWSLLLVVLTGCGGVLQEAPSAAPTAPAPTIVPPPPSPATPPPITPTAAAVPATASPRATAAGGSARAGCDHETVAAVVARFLDAVTAGDQARIAAVFSIAAGPPGVRPQGWYSVTDYPPGEGPRHFVAYSQDALLAYFRARHQQRERLQLLELSVAERTWHGGTDITYALSRMADDLGAGERRHLGKGAINCARRQIFVWSMGDPLAPPAAVPSPDGGWHRALPPDDTLGDARGRSGRERAGYAAHPGSHGGR